MMNRQTAVFTKNKPAYLLALLSSLAAFTAVTEADIIYKSVDHEGNTYYSDQPPNDNLLLIEHIQLPDYVQQDNPQQNAFLEQMSQTADRLKQDRLDRDALKLPQQQARQTISPPQYTPVVYEENHYYTPSRQWYPRRHFRDFPSIYDRNKNVRRLNLSDDQKDSGPVITPKSRLITP